MRQPVSTCSPHGRPAVVLAVSLSRADQQTMAALCDTASWRLMCVRGLSQALRRVKCRDVGVVICEHELLDGDWKTLCEQVRDSAHAPAFIVVSRLADAHLWVEALNLGAFDVLATPFNMEEVTRAVSCAITSHSIWHVSAGKKTVSLAQGGSI